MKPIHLFMLGALFLWPAAQAEDALTPEDFAVGFPLQTEGEYGAYALELNEAVYRAAATPDLSDLRVFDNRGTAQPHVLDLPQAVAAVQNVDLPLFPLRRSSPESQAPEEVLVETGPGGTVVRIRNGDAKADRSRLWGFLLDLKPLEGRAARLEFHWRPPEEGFVTRITLEGSDDLTRWHPLVQASLAELATKGQRIVRNAIDVPFPTPRYLRFAWPSTTGPRLEGVVARVRGNAEPAPLHWLEPTAVSDPEGGWRYDAGGFFPLRRLVVLPAENSLAKVRVESRLSDTATWRLRYRGLAYRLKVDGALLESDPVDLRSSDRFWRVVVEQSWSPGGSAPRLQLGWQPHRLRFSAGGEPPYLLAVGSVHAGPVDPALEQGFRSLLNTLPADAVGKARLETEVTLGGQAALVVPEPPRPLPWRIWILWSVLGLGVLVVAAMVRSLVREMRIQE
ncbi:MAG TPA: DUF3999 domain-containing protein [Oceanithermus profundus]|uniref:DUF3999 domain-containing protein n=1 Tax=Oceanithermus profundus TaxID=187137 RepID=A0A7C4V6X9_9DEIN|nr:DUF3999 domain-containing protein [Oceanithermus profundus]